MQDEELFPRKPVNSLLDKMGNMLALVVLITIAGVECAAIWGEQIRQLVAQVVA